jgi:mannose-1-phosphate guanylyltransferase
LLDVAYERLAGLVPAENRIVCAGQGHEKVIREALGLGEDQFLGEPVGRDTLNAVGYSTAVIAARDPEAVIAVFTADHIIEPVDEFRKIVEHGYRLAEEHAETLVTFGIAPTQAATGYGYLQLGERVDETARVVAEFREKPNAETAEGFFKAGAEKYLWNSGMFVWRAATMMDCIRRYEPENYAGIEKIVAAWNGAEREKTLGAVFPTLKKISIDYAVMEPASRDPKVRVAAVPMPLQWLDVGSWPMFAETCAKDENGNAIGAGKTLLLDTKGTLVASNDAGHLITTIGCEDLIIIHTPEATLVCRKDCAEGIKELHKLVGERFGKGLV